jgi:hypothetical protein
MTHLDDTADSWVRGEQFGVAQLTLYRSTHCWKSRWFIFLNRFRICVQRSSPKHIGRIITDTGKCRLHYRCQWGVLQNVNN